MFLGAILIFNRVVFVVCSVLVMERPIFQCSVCPEQRGSRRALGRHMIWHHRTAGSVPAPDGVCSSVRRVILRDAASSAAVGGPAVLSRDCVPRASRDPRVASGLPKPPSTPGVHVDQVQADRKQVDVAVGRLKRRHERDRTTLSLPTAELATWLGATAPDLPLLTCVGIVVAAKHFAGTQSPRRGIAEQAAVGRPAPHEPQELSKDMIRRRLFSAEHTGPGPTEVATTSDTVAPGSACDYSEPPTSDDEWRADIWRCYGSREVLPPSPFGCQQSPSLAFTGDAAPASSPVAGWSESSDDEPWGPDSPEQPLELDSHPECLPHWPLFRSLSGGFLKRGGNDWREEVRRWQNERTVATTRRKPRRRHPLRSRRGSRTRYAAAIAAIPPVQVQWMEAAAVAKPIAPGDVVLPSPPEAAAGLRRIRRVLLHRANLPLGCRLRKRKRSAPPSAQEAIDIDITAPQDSI